MEYEGSIGLVMKKMKKKIADFNFLGPFIIKHITAGSTRNATS
jgi:hypothetical protein